ncbi:hypothetical protein N7462_005210 [Penicillium macrosclerotiorum]|uniref:uncharacterized protein n=1 Tax=Penicillium macrosclerotiorum TaxID=303699 RepID=UPI002549739D|nr:uncharacterized protein N7462_005210 [Penicillium macrosclerotiorum]KAJ5690818.1 hypothetical protein N7462_005210 [Penicillium macrosclerotiorum]
MNGVTDPLLLRVPHVPPPSSFGLAHGNTPWLLQAPLRLLCVIAVAATHGSYCSAAAAAAAAAPFQVAQVAWTTPSHDSTVKVRYLHRSRAPRQLLLALGPSLLFSISHHWSGPPVNHPMTWVGFSLQLEGPETRDA